MKKALIIGAGASGIAVAKVFKENGIDFEVAEKGSKLGGLWRYNNDNGRSAAYRSLHINTNREVMAFSDFPMPTSYPMFPHHSQIVSYFEAYAEHFGFLDDIKFNTSVKRVNSLESHYEVVFEDGSKCKYEYVVVANGHHWKPKYPSPAFPGEYKGEIIHSHDYKVPAQLENKDVLIVGIGNSAVDIACEAARLHTGKVTISTRSGAYIVPNWIWSMPFDNLANDFTSRFPLWLQRILLKTTLWFARGNQKDYGVPVPNRPVLSEHPTLSQDLLSLTGRGLIDFKPNIERFEGKEVFFEDGSKQHFDLIIYATGYEVSFPFLKHIEEFNIQNNEIGLYKNMVHPSHTHLLFAGLIQPLGAIMPLVEVQAQWMAKILKGAYRFPSEVQMKEAIRLKKEQMAKRYKKSARHTLQVDFHNYKREIRKEMAN